MRAQEPAGRQAAGQDGLRLRQGDPHPRAAQAALRGGQPTQLRGVSHMPQIINFRLHACAILGPLLTSLSAALVQLFAEVCAVLGSK